MAVPWNKLNHKKQNHYVILATIVLAAITVGAAFLITTA